MTTLPPRRLAVLTAIAADPAGSLRTISAAAGLARRNGAQTHIAYLRATGLVEADGPPYRLTDAGRDALARATGGGVE